MGNVGQCPRYLAGDLGGGLNGVLMEGCSLYGSFILARD